MTIEIITAHEADQLVRLRRPLGTEYQGRFPEAAHACTDVGDDDDEELSQFGAFNAAPAVAVVLVAIAVVAALVLAATRHSGWLTW